MGNTTIPYMPTMGTQQKKEIKTIRERTITLKLSDEDCNRLARKCGKHGLTISQLIENFIGDLVGGTYSNGSDECYYANKWFERCWFGTDPPPTLLGSLLLDGYNPQEYLNLLDYIETAEQEKEYFKEHPEETDEEARYLDEDIANWEEELRSMRELWKPEKESDMEAELKRIKQWQKEKDTLML